ncbi:OmpP1/FadL family transporter [Rosettibacter firmus]|uniref:OmpP1/FadL family transporter n=1 Tax=Rosettibacter firmus TaxID=3111522 RepID=UPI00336C264C
MRKTFLVTILILVSYNFCLSQNFNDALRLTEPEIITGARALSMGNAYTALSNDFSATLFNPAGLGLIKKSEFSASFSYDSFSNSTTFFNRKEDFSNNITKLSELSFALPLPTIRGSFVLAFGYNQQKDFNYTMKFNGYNPNNNSLIQDLTNYNDDIAYKLVLSYPVYDRNNKYLYDTTLINGKLNQSGKIVQDGGLHNWSFSAALEIQENVFVGATLNVIGGDFRRDRQYWEDDINDYYSSNLLLDPLEPSSRDFKTFYMNDIIKWDVSGWNLNIGLLTKINKVFNFGFSIKTPRFYTIKETYFVDAYSDFAQTRFYLDPPIENKLEYKINTPYELSLGAAFNENNLNVSFDAKFIDYTQMEFKSGLDIRDIENNNRDIKELFRKVINLHAGFEYIIPFVNVAFRGGFMLLPSPYKDDPSDFDKKFITAGLGLNPGSNLSINLAYAYGWWKDIGDNYGSNLSRTYQDIERSNFILGVRYNF